MKNYKAAMYQQDVMEELSKNTNVIFYGPGYESFNPQERINDTINRLGGADILIVGHAWLVDKPSQIVDPYPLLQLDECKIPKFMFLNKEYTNLNAKLKWIKDKNFLYGFTHHHDIDFYQKKTNVPFKFIPFAFNENLFIQKDNFNKDIDFAFCGLLKNNFLNTGQTNARIRVMKKLFHCLGDIPIIKKADYNDCRLFWNAIPRNLFVMGLAKLSNKYRRLSNREYASLQMRSRTFLNTLSPLGLVGPRFFEIMACKTLLFCEESKNVQNIFPSECYMTFKSDFSDFDEKFKLAIGDGVEREKKVNIAFEMAHTQHTWKVRVKSIIKTINDSLK